jgi:hypothetical protein
MSFAWLITLKPDFSFIFEIAKLFVEMQRVSISDR